MQIAFDPEKERRNIAKHGVSLAEAAQLDWSTAVDWEDHRFDYREERRCALGLSGGRVFYVAYVDRKNVRRIISLRKANAREVLRYVHGKE